MIHSPLARANSRIALSSSRLAVQPVGLDGELMTIARVLAVTAPNSLSSGSVQPSRSSVIGTATTLAPLIASAPSKFGHAGAGTSTSSPSPQVACTAIWTACMPPPVTKNSSIENGWS